MSAGGHFGNKQTRGLRLGPCSGCGRAAGGTDGGSGARGGFPTKQGPLPLSPPRPPAQMPRTAPNPVVAGVVQGAIPVAPERTGREADGRGAAQDRYTDPLDRPEGVGIAQSPVRNPQSPYRPATGPPDPPKALLLAPPGPGAMGIGTGIATLAYKGLMDGNDRVACPPRSCTGRSVGARKSNTSRAVPRRALVSRPGPSCHRSVP